MAVPELKNVLKADDDDRVRTEAASTLGKIGADARSAVPVLIDALRDPSVVIRGKAVRAPRREQVARDSSDRRAQ